MALWGHAQICPVNLPKVSGIICWAKLFLTVFGPKIGHFGGLVQWAACPPSTARAASTGSYACVWAIKSGGSHVEKGPSELRSGPCSQRYGHFTVWDRCGANGHSWPPKKAAENPKMGFPGSPTRSVVSQKAPLARPRTGSCACVWAILRGGNQMTYVRIQ